MPEDVSTPDPTDTQGDATPENADLAAPTSVVGIGGSAGALDAYERFFLSFPKGSGAAFVLVAHLDAQHKGLMPDLIARCTVLPVVEIEDGTQLRADHVYVVPPGRRLGLLHGTLLLTEDDAPGLPIDAFFESLAADQGQRAVAVVLSGAGTDGTRGLSAIKEHFGRVLVQDPDTAEYPSMPSSAVATKLADFVLSPEDLARQVYDLVANAQSGLGSLDDVPASALQKILLLVRSRTGLDFTQYKKSTLVRRVDRRMKSHRVTNVAHYVRLLQDTPKEIEELARDFTINVTSFYRDPEAFEALGEHLRSYIVTNKQDVDTMRVWVAGCSTGEEAYSIAILLHELCEELGTRHTLKVQVFATDIDKDVIERARYAWYPKSVAYNVPPERLSRYFLEKDGGYQVRSDIRDLVIFALHNTFGDPPFTRLDLLCCRNLLIYLGADLQRQVMSLFHYALRPNGLLFLGGSETISQDSDRDRFATLNARWKIFRRGDGPPGTLPIQGDLVAQSITRLSAERAPSAPPQRLDVSQLAQSLLLSDFTPAAVVVNEQGDILFVNGRTGRYLELHPGKASMNVLEMARDALRYELPPLLSGAAQERREVKLDAVRMLVDGFAFTLSVRVRPLVGDPLLLMVVFDEQAPLVSDEQVPADSAQSNQVRALEQELRHTKESLQATIEEMAVSMEELRSTNEELQTTNEELQSTNEELVTSKEELQSLNEELVTINSEHERVIHDLAQANDDMKNLLDSAGIATVFLDNDLRIKRFTPRIAAIINLIPADLGRPIRDISLHLRYEHFSRDVQRVLDSLTLYETQVQALDDRWYLMRISPYRTSDNFIDGVVVTFTDIGVMKQLEGQLQLSLATTSAVLNSLHDPLLVLDEDLRAVMGNEALYTFVQATPRDVVGQLLYNVGNFVLDVPELHREVREVIATERPLVNYVLDLNVGHLGKRKMKIEVQPVVVENAENTLALLRLEDVTGLVERAAREGEDFTGSADDEDAR